MRNYYQRPGLFGFSLFPKVLKYLLISNIAIFILEHFLFKVLYVGNDSLSDIFFRYAALWPIGSGFFLPWQIFTYMFMHGGFMHLFLNMFVLWMFGVELENLWGPKKFLFYYLMTGAGAAIANLLIAPLFTSTGPTVGASGAIYGVLAAFAFLFPNRPIYIYFFIPIKAKYMILLYMALDLFSIINSSNTGIAHVAHLGGAVVGFIYLFATRNKSMNFFKNTGSGESRFTSWRSSSGSGSSGSRFAPFKQSSNGNYKRVDVKDVDYKDVETNYKQQIEDQEREAQEKIDAILDKLSEGGYQSLTEEEKKILFQESKKLR
jgi:membrane associated rhomboid family serine protease